MQPEMCAPNNYLIKEGEVGHKMYIIRRGRAEVLLGQSEEKIAVLESGDIFGEIVFFGQPTRVASVKAIEFCDCRTLEKSAFQWLMRQFPQEKLRFERLAQERLEQNVGYPSVLGSVRSAVLSPAAPSETQAGKSSHRRPGREAFSSHASSSAEHSTVASPRRPGREAFLSQASSLAESPTEEAKQKKRREDAARKASTGSELTRLPKMVKVMRPQAKATGGLTALASDAQSRISISAAASHESDDSAFSDIEDLVDIELRLPSETLSLSCQTGGCHNGYPDNNAPSQCDLQQFRSCHAGVQKSPGSPPSKLDRSPSRRTTDGSSTTRCQSTRCSSTRSLGIVKMKRASTDPSVGASMFPMPDWKATVVDSIKAFNKQKRTDIVKLTLRSLASFEGDFNHPLTCR